MKKKLIQATCLFFVMMLIFTILSRVSDSVNVIQIQTKNPANQMITHEVKGSGKVEGSQEVAVFVLENLQVEQVMVHAGQTVKKGDILLKLFQNSIQAALKNLDDKIKTLEEFSKDYDELYFQLALNYGSRDEITRGMRKLAQDAADGRLNPQEITEDTISGYLDTAGVPDPDLLIRTSGEQRLSNFLMWQLAYTEFYFTDVAWPDFHKEDLIRAIEKYNGRDRRYGGVKEE